MFSKNRKNKLISNLDRVNDNLNYNSFTGSKSLSENHDFNISDRRLKEEEKIKNNKSTDINKSDNKALYEELYNKIIGYNIDQKILYEDLYLFFFKKIPQNKTLSTNFNLRNNIIKDNANINLSENLLSDKTEKIITYDFLLKYQGIDIAIFLQK